jgi:ribokinase
MSTQGSAGTVTVVGSINADVSLSCRTLPQPGQTLLADSVRRSPGGKGANQAVAAARAGGARTSMVGAVGDDADGAQLRATLAGASVDTAGVRVVPGLATGLALITVDASGENTIVVAPGANAHLSIDATQRSRIAAADVVLAPLETPQAVVCEAARARRSGATFVLNAAPAAPLEPDLLAEVDLLVVNEGEACSVAGRGDLESALVELLHRVPAVLVTLGAAGSLLRQRGENEVRVPAVPAQARDTTAAGDTYCGVLAAALAGGTPIRDAMTLASAAASLAVERPGAQDSIPTAGQVQDRLAAAPRAIDPPGA